MFQHITVTDVLAILTALAVFLKAIAEFIKAIKKTRKREGPPKDPVGS